MRLDFSDSSTQKVTSVLKIFAGLSAAAFVLLYLYIVASRFAYPYEFQWMEGGMVDHIRRLQGGFPLYVAPSIDFVPYIYPPLYFYLASALTSLLGLGFMPLRLISVLSSFGIFAMLALIIWRETQDRLAALLGVGFFAATFAISGAWFDIGRVDSLFIFLTLIGMYLIRFGQFRFVVIIAAVVFFLATMTKQTALAITVAATVYLLVTNWRQGLLFAVIYAVLLVSSTFILDSASDGWYRYYILDLPGQHPWLKEMWVKFWTEDMLPVLLTVILSGVYILFSFRQERKRFLFYGLFTGAMILSSWLSRLHEGGYLNVLFPAFAVLALDFGMGIYVFSRLRYRYVPLLWVGVIFQFGLLIYNPQTYIPTEADRAAGDYLIDYIAALDGNVMVFHHGYLAKLAGKEEITAHRMAVEDVLRGTDEQAKTLLRSSIDAALQGQRFDHIIFDGSRDNFILVDYYFPELEPNYIGQGVIFPESMKEDFWPLGGLQIRPYYHFVPRN